MFKGKKNDCGHCITKFDLVQAAGVLLLAVFKAITVYRDYNQEKIDQGDSAKAELRKILKKAGIK